MSAPPRFRVIILLTALLISTALATTPDDNDIPTLAMRIRGPDASYKTDFPLELLCELSWLNFDAVNFDGDASVDYVTDLMTLCDSIGLYYSFCPAEIMQYQKHWADSAFRFWFRYEDASLTSDSAFAQCNTDYDSLINFMPADSFYELADISIDTTTGELSANLEGHDFLWFYEVYDEANSRQGKSSADTLDIPWDDYIPNVYTQAIDEDSILTLEEVEASGLYSIQKYYAENDSLYPVTFAMNFALLHHIDKDEYTGLIEDRGWTTMATQARCVRAVMEAEYLQLPDSGEQTVDTLDNSPQFIMLDYYPFRQVHPDSGEAEMCDDDWLFMVNHFEEGIDSTVIPASEYDVPVFYMPQAFGKAGGNVMINQSDSSMDYRSYYQRMPSPREFRMLCNLALLHQAKGIFPYNLCSYVEFAPNGSVPHCLMNSLLDRHNIPFDADYEEWRYTGRWPVNYSGDYSYIRPDSLPPWRDGYDPLFTLSAVPDTSGDGARVRENWYDWHFAPYADLYNSIGSIMGEIKTIGPEMHDLWWTPGDCSDSVSISYDAFPAPNNLIAPVLKVFENDDQSSYYFFYVDRYCVSDDNPYEITFDPSDLPEGADCSQRLLDHSRRFVMDGDWDRQDSVYVFLDTLDAGEARLVQLFDPEDGLDADVRITSPDVTLLYGDGYSTSRMEATVGDTVTVRADFYNMGTDTATAFVTFYDSTSSETLALDTLQFTGLPFNPDSACRSCDSDRASFQWAPDSSDIGVHRIMVFADSLSGEPRTSDNGVEFPFLVHPRDYATEVRGDPWDMDEDSTDAWFTSDIDSIAQSWDDSAWTDSVSGMFEGVIEYDTTAEYSFVGDISLSIPDSSVYYIDPERYHMLSLGIVCSNSNKGSGSAVNMSISWVDPDSTLHGWSNLLGSSYAVGNGWEEYAVLGPIDLNDITGLDWGDDDVMELWLSLRCNDTARPPQPIDVRIGWVRLEESAP